jgi:hypothetical protein
MKPVSLEEIEDGVRRVDRVVTSNRTLCCGVFVLFLGVLGFVVWMCILLTRIDAALEEDNVASMMGKTQDAMSSLASMVEGLREYVAEREANVTKVMLERANVATDVVKNYTTRAAWLARVHPELRMDLTHPAASGIRLVED